MALTANATIRSIPAGEHVADALNLAVVVAGGLTTLGVVLDWGVAPETKQRLQTKLESLLYRFRYTTVRTFGRDEVEFSLKPFKWLGQRFFSKRRMAVVSAIWVGLVPVAVLFAAAMTRRPIIHADPAVLEDVLARSAFGAVLFSLSISCTFWVSRLVLLLPIGRTLLATGVLLFIHLALFLVWRNMMEATSMFIGRVVFGAPDPFAGLSHFAFVHIWALLGEQDMSEHSFISFVFNNSYSFAPAYPSIPALEYGFQIVDTATALFANALRIALALMFILLIVYVRTIRLALIWFWSALIRSSALFSPPFSALAAIILAIDKRDAILGALARPFQ